MIRKLVFSLMLMCGMAASVAVAAQSIKTTPFAESVAELRAEAVKNAGSKTFASSYQLTGGATPVKVSVSLKSGEQVVIYSASSENTTPKDYWVINDAVVTSNGESSALTAKSSQVMGAVKFRTINNQGKLVSYNGIDLDNGIQLPMAASILISACDGAKSVTFDLMLEGASDTKAVVKVQKVNTKRVAALEASYPDEVSQYTSFGKAALPLLLLEPNSDADRGAAQGAVNLVKSNDALSDALKSANAIADIKTRSAAYVSILTRAIKVASLEEQLSWLKVSSVEAAIERLQESEGFDLAANEARLSELKSLVEGGFDGIYDLGSCDAICKAERALELQRQVILANPAFDFDKILVGRYQMPYNSRSVNSSSMGTQPNNWSNQTSARRNGFDAELGVLSNIRGELEYDTIYKPEWDTSMPDIQLNWDADKVLFTMNPDGEHHWQVYQYNLTEDKLEKITNGEEEHLDYFDANYLPNGKLLVISNVGQQGVPCVHGTDQVGNLCLLDPESGDMRRLTFDQDANWSPVMMHNGKVMYQRWEYTDLMHYYSRFVMSMNPDGTDQRALFGSGMTFPNTNFDARPLPDHPSKFVAVVSGHHGVTRAGRLFLFDPAVSRNTVDAMVHEFPFKDRELEVVVKDRLLEGVYPIFIKPFPIDNETMLVTAKMSANGLWGLYLVDTDDNLVLLEEYEGEGMIHATPLRKTIAPPVIPDNINLESKTATVFIQDIYEGEGLPGVPRGTVKELRLHTYDYAYINSPSNHYGMGIQSGWDMKTQLGTVPVEEDGSATFVIPANTPISIQPLDSEGRAIQWMRSWFTGMPGEKISCVGCHEDQNQIPKPVKTIAANRAPHELNVPEGGIRPFTFDLEVQPVLDRACVSCHDGNGTSKLNFTGHIKDENGYGTSHLALHPYVHRQGAEAAMKVMVPYEYHASNSRLIQLLKNGHYGVELTDKEWKALYNWIDYNVPDKGTFDPVAEYHGCAQYERRIELNAKYTNNSFRNEWRSQIKEYTEYLESQGEVEPTKVSFEAPKFKDVTVKGFPTEVTTGERKVIEVAPGVEIAFVKIPAGDFVMGENRINSNASPEVKASVKKAFWMSETELSNAQVRAILPEHNSRYYDQQWKDHVVEGYPANGDDQPAIRISWNSAMEYCEKLSEQIKLKVMLPTETQWEWAARAGTATDYWYGTLNSDFGAKENLSDKQMLKMAVYRVDPQPMTPGNDVWGNISWYDYCTYIPKMESVDDGYMLPANGGSYEANPFGLYDMLGNVAEWTRDDYYPRSQKVTKKSTSEQKVVKGGSWNTHPKDARVATRRNFFPWQAPYNVGMRLVIEE